MARESASVTATPRKSVRVQHRSRSTGHISVGADYLAYAIDTKRWGEGRGIRYRHVAFMERHKSYLRTPEWRAVRKSALVAAGNVCSKCRRGGRLEVHHKTYARWGKEELDDLLVLCHACHLKTHGKEKFDKIR